jgi:prophage tail gpP-like protein
MTIPAGSGVGAAKPAITPDLSALSDKDLEGLVARVCSPYGKVVRVAVHAAHTNPSVRAFALVDMSAVNEAERLAAAFKRPRMGSAVLLLLEPRTHS